MATPTCLSHITINGLLYHGFDPRPNQPPDPPDHVGWSSAATDDGFVPPSKYADPDIICYVSGTSPAAHAPVRPGDRVQVHWNGWPVGHVGPVLTYLARCDDSGKGGGCAGEDKTALRWTKVDDSSPVVVPLARGEEDVVGRGQGRLTRERWATDVMIAANNTWLVQVPRGLRTGAYVLRQEIVALHFAERKGGAQNYPVCVNLWVEGEDGENEFNMDGFDARGFYKEDDPGVWGNVSAAMTKYVIPGPTVAVGAAPVPHAQQRVTSARAVGTPVIVLSGSTTAPFGGTATPRAKARVEGRRYAGDRA
ncbi:lytic polysaccharide monooxygenase [Canariomyces notabilis]|uniref:lytic cellulose monooxygenase (C4-dehydrogenating) n=1 Tax=Canariomyces notabilis TaxID=2074819 RepID=A0AAN6TEI6_9PEZI|nr:lytic polysaccharide monooxygenase [Canariomyces arenarius]